MNLMKIEKNLSRSYQFFFFFQICISNCSTIEINSLHENYFHEKIE